MAKSKASSKEEAMKKELWQTFLNEVDDLLESAEQLLLDLENNPEDEELISGLFRAMHTFKGTSGMMGLSNIETFAHSAEDVMDLVRDKTLSLTPDIMDMMFETLDELKDAREFINNNLSDIELGKVTNLIERLQATHRKATGKDEETGTTHSEISQEEADSLWQNLAEECEEQMDEIEKCLLAIEEDKDYEQSINSLFRSLHTLKGHFGLAGLPVTTTFTHKCEDLVGLLKENRIERSTSLIDILLNSIDILRCNFKSILTNRADISESKIEHSQKSLETIINEHLPEGDAEAIESLIRDDDSMEVDAEYLSVYFDMVWAHLANCKETLSSLTPESISEARNQITEILEELAFATEQIAQSCLIENIEKFNDCIAAANENTNIKDISSQFNELWHHFWDFESEADIEKINTDIRNGASQQASSEPKATKSTETPASESPVEPKQVGVDIENYLIKVWELLGNTRNQLNTAKNSSKDIDASTHENLASLKAHCDTAKEVDIDKEFEALVLLANSAPVDFAKLGGQLNDIYTYFWEKEEEWSSNEVTHLTPATPTSAKEPEDLPADKATPDSNDPPEDAASSSAIQASDFFSEESKADPVQDNPCAEDQSVSEEEFFSTSDNVVPLGNAVTSSTSESNTSLQLDPIFAHDYLEKVEEDISIFRTKILEDHPPAELLSHLSVMKSDAARLEYQGIVNILEEIDADFHKSSSDTLDKDLLGRYELRLFEELTKIEELLPDNFPPGKSRKINISYMFRQWHAEHVYEAMACLSDQTQLLLSLKDRWMAGIENDSNLTQIFITIRDQLQTLLNACDFYHFQESAKGVLFFIDYFNRASLDISLLSETLVAKSHEFTTALGGIVQAAREGYPVNETLVSEIIDSTEQEIQHEHEEPPISIANAFLKSINLPPGFEEILYDEVLMRVGEALQEDQGLYLIYTDMEEDEAIADGFMELLEDDLFDAITNATGYIDDRSIFHFLIASDLDSDALTNQLEKIDPSSEKLRLITLTLNHQRSAQRDQQGAGLSLLEANAAAGLDEEYLAHYSELQQSVGQLISVRSHIGQIKSTLGDIDLFETVEKVMTQSGGDWKSARTEVRTTLDNYDSDLKHLFQAQEDIGAVLDHLQDTVNSIRDKPMSQLFSPTQEWLQKVAEQLDKPVKAQFIGEDVQAEQTHMAVIHEPLRQILYLIMSFSVESAADRKAAGKSIFANITVTADTRDDHVEIKISDDGQGLQKSLFIPDDEEIEDLNTDIPLEELIFNNGLGKVVSKQNKQGFDFCQTREDLGMAGIHFAIAAEFDQINEFVFTLPLSNNIVDGILVEADNVRYIMPVHSIKRIVNPNELEYIQVSANNKAPLIKLDGEVIPAQFLKSKDQHRDIEGKIVIITEYRGKTKALAVDQLYGMQQVMVTPLAGHLSTIQGVSGCALLGRNDVGMVIDTAQLF